MRLVSFDGGRLGVILGTEVIEFDTIQDPERGLLGLIERGALPTVPADAPRIPLDSVTLDAPLPRPGKIIGAPVNYVDHQQEMHEPTTIADLGVFLKAPTSVLVPNGSVQLPYTDKRTDQEAELAVVIGRTGRNIPVDQAIDYVFGYMCGLDISVRSSEDRSTRKSFDTFTPLGPWITTVDEVGDGSGLRLRGWVGETLRQDADTSDMVFDVAEIIAYASSVMTLRPGDVIVTGTPAGVGPITGGDRITVEIERVGRLEVTVSDALARPYSDRPGKRVVPA